MKKREKLMKLQFETSRLKPASEREESLIYVKLSRIRTSFRESPSDSPVNGVVGWRGEPLLKFEAFAKREIFVRSLCKPASGILARPKAALSGRSSSCLPACLPAQLHNAKCIRVVVRCVKYTLRNRSTFHPHHRYYRCGGCRASKFSRLALLIEQPDITKRSQRSVALRPSIINREYIVSVLSHYRRIIGCPSVRHEIIFTDNCFRRWVSF